MKMLFYRVPVDPLEWQISQDAANCIFAWLANTVGAAESVLRVAATGHDKRLFFGVNFCSLNCYLDPNCSTYLISFEYPPRRHVTAKLPDNCPSPWNPGHLFFSCWLLCSLL